MHSDPPRADGDADPEEVDPNDVEEVLDDEDPDLPPVVAAVLYRSMEPPPPEPEEEHDTVPPPPPEPAPRLSRRFYTDDERQALREISPGLDGPDVDRMLDALKLPSAPPAPPSIPPVLDLKHVAEHEADPDEEAFFRRYVRAPEPPKPKS
jgi:hypothetical protein